MLLIAPDSFKGTFTAREVAAAIARGVPLDVAVELCPVADGGEGTLDVVLAASQGSAERVAAHDPLGRRVDAPLGWLDGGRTAIVEMAGASGLALVPESERDAEAASTRGTGELIAAAVASGARRIVVMAGGSATTDGGAGALEAIADGGGLRGAALVVACDVTTSFEHAATVYGPQKGASPVAVERLTRRLHSSAAALPRDPRGVPMTGAAGGLAGALWAVHGAQLVGGADWVLGAVGFDARLARAAAVVTGEGRLDRQTFAGKLVGTVATRCRRAGVPLHAVVGSLTLTDRETRELGLASVHAAPDEAAMAAAGSTIADDLAASRRPSTARDSLRHNDCEEHMPVGIAKHRGLG
ncbi:glycerate kinase [Conexibacter stalactiti]|uniref:Glycerate kinase n=1 Tax=Conexibacter stalactiti TaxID=1940611 RepID=A0ABU4HZD2_9ACTN|nr:glycerate kinase [Conexibacter stalactiti]MDW5597424.1 glycerate kinase [Conexibacter stalactiti]MEC5038066.1 glycerate kinase [Conexibacter stalactiti]